MAVVLTRKFVCSRCEILCLILFQDSNMLLMPQILHLSGWNKFETQQLTCQVHIALIDLIWMCVLGFYCVTLNNVLLLIVSNCWTLHKFGTWRESQKIGCVNVVVVISTFCCVSMCCKMFLKHFLLCARYSFLWWMIVFVIYAPAESPHHMY